MVDAGVNCKQILSKMKLSGLSPSKLRGIFITHEHNDHVCGVRVLAKKLDIPVFMTKGTYQGLYLTNRPDAVRLIESDQSIDLCSFIIHPVLKNHDGKEPTSFRVEHQGINIGVFTDIGSPCDNVTAHLKVCDALFLESNYDEKMLWGGSYPPHLKERVASDVGHLSNLQAAELLEEHAAEHLKVVLLSHLSGENNTPEIAYQAVKHLEDRFQIIVTSRKQPSEVITVIKRVN